MSHFFTVVILPKNIHFDLEIGNPQEIKSEVSRLLAPFNEELEVPTWWAKCWCVGEMPSPKFGSKWIKNSEP
jgi:hypothetical protein